jgi:hypothetical protein
MTSLDAVCQVIMRFHFRGSGDPDMPGEQPVIVVAESFCDVRGRRTERVPDLIAEFEIVSCGRAINKFVHLFLELVRKLPGVEIFVALCTHDSRQSKRRSFVPAPRSHCTQLAPVHPAPGTSHPAHLAPQTLHPCTLHPAPCTLHLAPCTLHLAPCTLHLAPCTLHLAPCTLHLAPFGAPPLTRRARLNEHSFSHASERRRPQNPGLQP